jgi:hypothetical protein
MIKAPMNANAAQIINALIGRASPMHASMSRVRGGI